MVKDLIKRRLMRTPLWLMLRDRKKVTRAQVVQRCIDVRKARTYLEIGVSVGASFAAVRAPRKIGVDPIAPAPLVVEELRKPGVRYFESTSDAFFELAAPEALAEGVDVVFVDGLHTYAQAYRDTIHALEYLTPGGIVLLHDCLPANENEATAATSGDEVRAILEAKGVEWDGAWTGDVWKAIVALRRHTELETDVLNCDCGVGVVRRGTNDEPLRISDAEIEAMQFGDLAANARQLLGLRTPAYLEWVLSSRGK